MKKKYVPPAVVFEEIEEQDCLMITGSNPDISSPEVKFPEEGADWGEDEDDI